MTLSQYKKIADEIGGENGRTIRELIRELEEAREIISERKSPVVLGSKEVAEMLGIDPKNMHHTRKTKLFPEPDTYVGTRPLWLLNTIRIYQERIEEWRDKKDT